MKKNSLTKAVVAGVVGLAGLGSIAQAVNLNPDGLGQVLLYPYYTTQGGNDTLISVVNTSDVAKAVKVRFLEGRNSREVRDFHLYLSPYDVWTAGIFAIPGEDRAGLYTRDRSCTVPDIVNGLGPELGNIGGTYYVPFAEWAYADLDHTAAAPHLGSPARTREGYLEMIEMGNVTGATQAGWIKHNASGVPANCAALTAAWDGGVWTADSTTGLSAPNGAGQLFGNAMIVNAAAGTIAGYSADAIEGFNYTILHAPPGDTQPGLESVNDPVGGFVNVSAYVFDFGQLVTATYDDSEIYGTIDSLSALYMSPVVINEYYLDGNDTVTASSEWLINFPTKRYYVDDRPWVDLSLQVQASFNPDAPRAPFSNPFRNGGSCETIRVRIYDREERVPAGGGVPFSPPRPGAPADALCWEAQVVAFGQGDRITAGESSEILGSTYFNNITPPAGFAAGWAAIEFGSRVGNVFTVPALRASNEGNVFRGLPVTGFFVTKYDNGVNNSGVLANYTTLFRHRTERDCTNTGGTCS